MSWLFSIRCLYISCHSLAVCLIFIHPEPRIRFLCHSCERKWHNLLMKSYIITWGLIETNCIRDHLIITIIFLGIVESIEFRCVLNTTSLTRYKTKATVFEKVSCLTINFISPWVSLGSLPFSPFVKAPNFDL
jgi:hypothetical protein